MCFLIASTRSPKKSLNFVAKSGSCRWQDGSAFSMHDLHKNVLLAKIIPRSNNVFCMAADSLVALIRLSLVACWMWLHPQHLFINRPVATRQMSLEKAAVILQISEDFLDIQEVSQEDETTTDILCRMVEIFKKNSHVRVQQYWEFTVPYNTDAVFTSHFYMSRCSRRFWPYKIVEHTEFIVSVLKRVFQN